jgi:hypothetical protein
VLDPGVAVDDHRHVVVKQRAALGHHHHPELARRGEHLLALLATRLVVALDRERADRLEPAQVRKRASSSWRSRP